MNGTDAEGRTSVRSLVWNARERRPRMPLRLVAGIGLWVAVSVVVSAPLEALLTGRTPVFDFRTSYLGNVTVNFVAAIVGAVVTPVAVYLAGRYVDRRRFRDFGFGIDRRWWTDLAFGFVLGGGLVTGIFLLEYALGWITVTGFFVAGGVPGRYFLPFFLLSVFGYAAGSFAEELLYRGFLLTNLSEGLRIGPIGPTGAIAGAIVVTSGAFAAAHATAPNATAISTLAIALAGVFLALGYVLTCDLALPIGVHAAWNFFEGNLYGFPISGSGTTSVVQIEQGGPAAVTGGAFGPEAGLVGVAAILLGMVAIVLWVRYTRRYWGFHSAIATPELRWRSS